MGLDITAYSKITPIDGEYNDDDDFVTSSGEVLVWRDVFTPMVNHHDFNERADGVLYDKPHRFSESLSFGGSYSGYGRWREDLAELAGYEPTPNHDRPYSNSAWESDSGPFWELIKFSDCEGTIGPITSKKLLKDFQDFHDKAITHNEDRPFFLSNYKSFLEAFELASDEGAVIFH